MQYVIFGLNKNRNALRGERINAAEMLFLIVLSFLAHGYFPALFRKSHHKIQQTGDILWNRDFTI